LLWIDVLFPQSVEASVLRLVTSFAVILQNWEVRNEKCELYPFFVQTQKKRRLMVYWVVCVDDGGFIKPAVNGEAFSLDH
jgi:hypothetical protein